MLNPNDDNRKPVEIAGRAMAIIFGITFGGIGLAMIGFLWTEHGFGDPPMFFKIFGTLIALPFVSFGGMFLLAGFGLRKFAPKLSAQSLAERLKESRDELSDQPKVNSGLSTSYTCPHCGAPLASSSNASPHGDVKCGHCETWFNIYGK